VTVESIPNAGGTKY